MNENLPPDPSLFSRTLWVLIGIFILGAAGRILVTDEPIDKRRAAGEIILAIVGAFIMHFFGMVKGMSTPETLLYGSLASLGTIRLLQWAVKVFQAVSKKEI